ncbi:putative MFS multidrug transporter [Aspergillus tanneri]|uniref:Major facilitator superfamily (MFS) profile domain-containing protein n=1 Tax=Aspergillus tanneri TaxID=1220188 RepID=A0A5M9M9N4_9EURO|nr:uncharacterized protein ATNIH1004_010270 [Aspergillus tanneri]KAA8643501.1 hypothetical protein ATNIH1004_010270 [Aspergillus tanneri]
MIKAYRYIREKTGGPSEPSSRKTQKPLCSHLAQQRRQRQQHSQDTTIRSTENEVPLQDMGASSVQEQRNILQGYPQSGEKCQVCKEERRRERVYSWKLIGGLCLPFTLATLDLTIVATAVPSIASHFNKFDELNWIVTAFTLTSTAFIPMFGQLADVFGRHAVLQLALFLMLIGSVLCAAAQTWGMLLLGRALQGTSSAGLMNIIMIILADKVSLKVNAKNNSLFAFVGGIGYSIGPVIGGYLTDDNWRYCFVIPIPIAFFSHILIYFLLRKELVEGTIFRRGSRMSSLLPALATLDVFGSALFIFGIGLIILATAWGGAAYAWTAPQVLGPLIVGAICFVLFFVYYMADDSTAMFSVFYFIGIYFTLVEAYQASRAGLQLLYYIPGLGAGVYTAMFLCNVVPAQTFFPLNFGSIISTIGLAVIPYAIHVQNTGLLNGMMALAGAGTGLRFMPATLHAVGVWPERIAPAMSLMRFAMPFGGTIGLTIMGSVFNNKFGPSLGLSSAGNANFNVHDTSSLSVITTLSPAAQKVVRMAGKDAIMWAYISILPVMGVSLISGLLMGNVWIKPKSKDEDQEHVDAEGSRHSEVVYVSYLWALLKGNVTSYKQISRPVAEREKQ